MVKASSNLQILAVRKLGGRECRYSLISPSDVAVVFLGSAVRRGLLPDNGFPLQAVRANRLYLRTGNGVYYFTNRSLRDLCRHVDPQVFLTIHKAMAVNIRRAREIDFGEKQIGITNGDGTLTWFTVSRRYMQGLRQTLALPAKRGTRHG